MLDDLIGIPFKRGGRDKAGYDCWGLVMEVYRRFGIELREYECGLYSPEYIDGCVDDYRANWQPVQPPYPVPALMVIRFNETIFCNHVGVHIGYGKFIHTREKVGVNIDRIESPAWKRKIEGFYVPGWV